MSIVYAVVAKGEVVLAHYTNTSGNFITITSFLLRKLPPYESQLSYNYGGYQYHILVDKGITFLCLAEDTVDYRIAFSFLFDTKERFFSKYPQIDRMQLYAFGLNPEFSRVLANQMDYFSHNPAADKINLVKGQMEAHKQLMTDNLEKLFEREGRVELLVGKTEEVSEQTEQFLKQGTKLNWAFFKRNLRYWGFLLVLAMVSLDGI